MKRSFVPAVALFMFMVAGSALAQVPRIITYQGVFTDVGGNPIPDGERSMTLSIYDAAVGGTPLYTETQNARFVRGVFNVAIGSVTPFPSTLLFNKPYYLGVSVEGGTELAPRTQMTTDAFAMRAVFANVADSLSPGARGVVTSVNGLSGALNLSGTGNTTVSQTGNTIVINSDGVASLNGATGAVELVGGGGTTVTRSGNRVTIATNAGTGSMQGVVPLDPSISIKDGLGPIAQIGVTELGITTPKLANEAVTTQKLANNAITDAKIAGGISYSKITGAPITLPPSGPAGGDLTGTYPSPTVATGAITTTKIADNAVTNAKVASGISYSKLTGAPTALPPDGPAGGDLTGTYPNPTIAPGAVTNSKIADGSVSNSKIEDGAVGTSKLANGSVTTAKIADGNITSSKIADGNVTAAKIADGNVTTAKIADGNVTSAKIANGGVTTAKIADGNVTTPKLADGSVTTPKIADANVTTPKIADANVTTPKIADGAVIDAKVANGISYSKLSGAPTSLPPNGPAGGDLNGIYPNPTIAANAVTTMKIADANVTTPKLADNSVTTDKLADLAVTTAKIADAAVVDSKVANGISYSKLAGAPTSLPPNGPAGGDLTGTYPNPTIGTSAVTNAKLAADAVTSDKIADGTIVNADVSPTAAIAYSKLNLTNSIQNGDLTANSVTTSKVANGTVTTSKLADSAVSGLKLLTFAVTDRHIADGAVTSAKIADGAIVDADVSPTAAIAYSKLALTNSIQNGDLTANSVTTSKVANGTVTTSKLADSAVSGLKLLTFAVTDRHIANGAVTLPKVNSTGAVTGDVIKYDGTNVVWGSGNATGPAGGDLTGTYPNPTIANNAVTSAKILDGTIVDADVSPTAAIAYSKLALNNSIQNGDLTANSVTTSKVANGTVTTSKLADSAVSGLKLLTFAVTDRHIADGAVTSAKIADGAIVDADVSPTAAIAYSKLALNNSIQNGDLTANSVTTSKVANGTVTTSKLADSAVSGLKILTFAVTDRHIADGAVTLPKINPTGAASGNVITYNGTNVVWSPASAGGAAGGDLTGTYPNPTIANDAVTSAKIADGTIVNADVSPTAAIAYSKLALTNSIQNGDLTVNSVTTSRVANGTVTTSKMADSAISGLKLLTFAVTDRHIADGAVTLPKINSTGAVSGNVITYNGTSVVWGSGGASGAAGGDLTGTYPNPTIANNAVTSAKILDGTIVDADVSPTAAIAYSKLALNNSIQNGDIVANAITTSKVANGTVTTSKMADSAISGLKLLTFAVTNRHLSANAVTTDKIDPTGAVSGNVITYNGTNVVWSSGGAAGAAGGDLTGTYPNPTIANNAVTSAKILDGTIVDADVSPTAAIAYSKLALNNSIQNGDIVANAITTSKVANGTVTTSKMADSAISGLKLLTFAVTNRHLSANAVSMDKIDPTGAATGNVITYNGTNVVWSAGGGASGAAGGDLTGTYPNPTIASNAVTSAKILDGTIVDADVSPTAAIAYSKLALNNSIQNGDIVANAITTSKVANGTVTTSKMADSAISGLKLLTFAVTNRHLSANAVTTDKIDPTGATSGQVLGYNGTSVVWTTPSGGGAAGGDLTGTYPNPTVADNAITSLKIQDGAVNNQDIAANAITTSKVANGTVTTSKMADSAISGLKLLTFAVTNRHLADGAVTNTKVSGAGAASGDVLTYNGTSVVWAAPGGGGTAGGDLTGTYPNPDIAANAVGTTEMADNSVTSLKIVDGAVSNQDLSANSVTTSKVANGTVTTSKMADSAISGLKLLTFAVTNRHLASGAVSTDKVSGAGATNGQVLMYNSGTNTVGWANPSVGLAYNRVAISNINSPYTVPVGTDIVGVDVTAGPVTVTLPPANSVPSGKIIMVKNELGNAATNNITIQRNGTDLINASSTSVTINTGNGVNGFRFYSDGISRWHQI